MSGISVVVASYKRVDRLAMCLTALRAQTRAVDEVLVVAHTSDLATASYVAALESDWRELSLVHVVRPGSVAAYNRGLAAAREPLVAYIDDDAVPSIDWVERIMQTFQQDERIAAVGGRDVVVDDRQHGFRRRFAVVGGPPSVGRLQWWGRMIANHHIGAGPPRDVDVLKGVNMSFRRAAVAAHGFDERLRGKGAQVHSELSICLPLRRQGLRVVYDPSIVVIHYPAPRPAGDHRHGFDAEMVFAAAHNEALQIIDYFGLVQRLVFAAWGLTIGTTEAPGFAVFVRDVLTRRSAAGRRLAAAQRGRCAAWLIHRRSRRAQADAPSVLGATAGAPNRGSSTFSA